MHNDGDVVSVTSISGKTYQYVWKSDPREGGVKRVYFPPDMSYAVAIYKKRQSPVSIARLKEIISQYHDQIFDGPGSQYWSKAFCWPFDVIHDGENDGLVMPVYPSNFFFEQDGKKMGVRIVKLKGTEKNGANFVDPANRFGRLNDADVGDFRNYLGVCLMLARGIRRLHFAGLAHSDLSMNNVLIDPANNAAVIIDIDGLVVPGKYAPDVAGTRGYLAPEVMAGNELPNQKTDLHALAVLIYQYLLCRHPLNGCAHFDDVGQDNDVQEALLFGSRATFVEHPTDKSNHYGTDWVVNNHKLHRKERELPFVFPWMDLDKLPYTICGPYLSRLFEKAFIDGLHNPIRRPRAMEWESALCKTIDLLVQCQNPACSQKWMIYDPAKKRQVCPFCGHEYKTEFPVLHLHRKFKGVWVSDDISIAGQNGLRIRTWHSRIGVAWSEQNSAEEKLPLAVLMYHQGQWLMRNLRAEGMMLLDGNKTIPVGGNIVLKDGMEIRLEKDGSRMVKIEMVNQ